MSTGKQYYKHKLNSHNAFQGTSAPLPAQMTTSMSPLVHTPSYSSAGIVASKSSLPRKSTGSINTWSTPPSLLSQQRPVLGNSTFGNRDIPGSGTKPVWPQSRRHKKDFYKDNLYISGKENLGVTNAKSNFNSPSRKKTLSEFASPPSLDTYVPYSSLSSSSPSTEFPLRPGMNSSASALHSRVRYAGNSDAFVKTPIPVNQTDDTYKRTGLYTRPYNDRHSAPPLPGSMSALANMARTRSHDAEFEAIQHLHDTVKRFPKLDHMQNIIIKQENEIADLKRHSEKPACFEDKYLKRESTSSEPGEDVIAEFEKQIILKNQAVFNLESSYSKAMEENERLRNQLFTVEEYLRDLPTKEENCAQIEQLDLLKTKYDELCRDCDKKSDEIAKLNETVKSKEEVICSQKKTVDNLITKERKVTNTREEIDNMQKAISKLQRDLSDSERKLESSFNIREEYARKVEDLEEDLNVCKKKITELDLSLEQAISERKKACIELKECKESSENQIRQLEEVIIQKSSENEELLSTIVEKLSVCLNDLRTTVRLGRTLAQGQDPNMSLLLGIAPDLMGVSLNTGEVTNDLEHILGGISEIQREANEIRMFLSDNYAEQVGSDACVQQ